MEEKFAVRTSIKNSGINIVFVIFWCSIAVYNLYFAPGESVDLYAMIIWHLLMGIVIYALIRSFVFKIKVYDDYLVIRNVFSKKTVQFSEITHIKKFKYTQTKHPKTIYKVYRAKRKLFEIYCYQPKKGLFEINCHHMDELENTDKLFDVFLEQGLMAINMVGEYSPIAPRSNYK